MDLTSVLAQRPKVEQFRRRHRTGLLTLLFTDIVGSTKLKQDLGDQRAIELIQAHHDKVRQVLALFPEGEEIDTAGDSFFILFTKPSDATRFALLVQSQVRQLAKETGIPVLDRIGIHVGEVFIDESGEAKAKDLYGIQVDTSARIMALAQADQILMSRFAFDNARQVLRGQDLEGLGPLSWLNHGPYLAKGVDEPLEICEVGELGQAVLAPPPDSEKAKRHISADGEPVLGWRPAVGQKVPGTSWVLEKKLGEGGFGEVWLGLQTTLKERRVFKFCFRADRVRSLKREVTLFRLMKERVGDHPNIVSLREVYLEVPPYYVEMDYVAGQDLRHWCEEQGGPAKVRLDIKLEIVAQIADALQAAHDAGVIHRDVKPGNILVREQSAPDPSSPVSRHPSLLAKLADFGIGQVVSQELLAGLTRLGFTQTMISPGSSQSGTQLYMAPELLGGKPASPRSDIYSLGVALFQLLCGDFTRPLTTDWMREIDDPLLRDDLMHCFVGNPQERFAGAAQLAGNLRALGQRQAALAREKADQAAWERASYLRGVVRTGAVAIVMIGAFALLSVSAWLHSREEARQRQRAEESSRLLADALSQLELQKIQTARLSIELSNTLSKGGPGQIHTLRSTLAMVQTNTFALEPSAPLVASTVIPPTPRAQDADTNRHIQRNPDDVTNTEASVRETARLLAEAKALARNEATLKATEGPFQSLAIEQAKAEASARERARAKAEAEELEQQRLAAIKAKNTAGTEQMVETRVPAVLTNTNVWSGAKLPVMGGMSSLEAKQTIPSPDGKWIISYSISTNAAQIWDVEAGKPIGRLLLHSAPVTEAQFSQNGLKVVTASQDRTARIWDTKSGLPLSDGLPHEAAVLMGRFSPDGGKVVTAAADKTVRVWNAQTGQPWTKPLRQDNTTITIRFSQDGNQIITIDDRGVVTIWDARTGGVRLRNDPAIGKISIKG
jgi:serine/threonine protein kinase/class 3 adenylate cyclase